MPFLTTDLSKLGRIGPDGVGSWAKQFQPGFDFPLPKMLDRWTQERPDSCALVFLADGENESERLTYGKLGRRVAALSSALHEAGASGQPVLLLHRPCLSFVVAYCACLRSGAIAVPVPDESRSRSWDRARAIAVHSRAVAILGDETGGAAEALGLPSLLEPGEAAGTLPAAQIPWESPAFLQYTSGSTGAPKGVIVTQASLASNLNMLAAAFGVHEATRLVTWLPMFHDMGLVTLAMALYHGVPSVLIPPLRFMQRPIRWLAAISRYRGTLSGGPNFAFETCLTRIGTADAEQLDLGSWECAFCGAEPVRAATMSAFARRFERQGFRLSALYPAYGLAEATLIVSGGQAGAGFKVLPPDAARTESDPIVGCGRAIAPGRVWIVDPQTGVPVPEGRTGEIWASGPHIAAGYWREPSLTEQIFRARLPGQADAFLRTGDLGFIWNGELYISGRLKDLMIIQGRNLHPEDVEATVRGSHPAFAEMSAAFSVDTGDVEEVVVVQEVRRDGLGTLDVQEATRAAALAVAGAQGIRAREIVLVTPGAVPRTSSGKVQRARCRELYLEGTLRRAGACGHSAA